MERRGLNCPRLFYRMLRYMWKKTGKFTGAEVIAVCPGAGRGTYYVRSDALGE